MKTLSLLSSVLAFALVACGGTDKPSTNPAPATTAEPAAPADDPGAAPTGEPAAPAGAAAAELAAFEAAQPVLEKYCAKCHGPDGKEKALEHFSMATYPPTSHHGDIAHELREVLGLTGEEPTMPLDDPGAVQGEELEKVVAWIDAYEAAHPEAAGEHDDGDHEH